MAFKDLFSKQAQDYARFRPQYPANLFEYLASLTTAHKLAWDCGTGSGQAAQGLVPYFEKIVATDEQQGVIRVVERQRQRIDDVGRGLFGNDSARDDLRRPPRGTGPCPAANILLDRRTPSPFGRGLG